MATNKSELGVWITGHDNLSPTLKSMQSNVIRFVGAISAALAAVKSVAFPVESAAAFEKEMKNVQKTTNFSEKQIESMGRALNSMSKEMVASQIELAKIAAVAGQLGLGRAGTEAITKFTESVAKASVTFGIGAESLSEYTAQLLNVFNIPVENVESLFSAINEVSNNSVASAEKLIDIMKRVGNVAGLTASEVIALAATTQDLGVSSEVAGTTLVKILSNMTAKASDFAAVMSTSTDDWVDTVEKDGLAALKKVLDEINKLPAAAKAANIRDLFGGGRIFSLAAKLAGDAANDFAILDKNLKLAVNSFAEGQSSIREYDIVASSLSARVDNLKNNFVALAQETGDNLIPVLKDVTETFKKFLNTPEVAAFADSLADSFGNFLQSIADNLDNIENLTDAFKKFVAVAKAFIAIAIGKAILGMGIHVANMVVGVYNMATGVKAATASWGALGLAIQKAAGVKQPVNYSFEAQNARATASRDAQGIAASNLAISQREEAILKNNLEWENRKLAIAKANIVARQQAIALAGTQTAADGASLRANAQQVALREANIIQLEAEIIANAEILALQEAQVITSRKQVAGQIGLLATIRGRAAAEGISFAASAAAYAKEAALLRVAGLKAKVAATGVLGLVGSTLGKIPGLLLSPWVLILGTIGTLVYQFWDEIKAFFGFGLDQIEATERAANKVKANARRDAEAAIDAYREVLKKTENEGDLVARVKLLFEEGGGESLAEAERLIKARMEDLSKTSEGLGAIVRLGAEDLDIWSDKMASIDTLAQNITANIAKAAEEIKKLENQKARPQLGSDRGGTEDALLDNQLLALYKKQSEEQEKLANLAEARRVSEQASATIAKNAEEAQRRQLIVVREREELQALSQKTMTADLVAWIQLNIEAAKYRKTLDEANKEAQAAQEIIEQNQSALTAKGVTAEDIASGTVGGNEDLRVSLENLRVAQQDLANANQLASQSWIEGNAVADRANNIYNNAIPSVREYMDELLRSGDAGIALESLTSAFLAFFKTNNKLINDIPRMTEAVKTAAVQLIKVSKAAKEFGDSRKYIDTIASSITGMADNLKSSVAGMVKDFTGLSDAAETAAKNAARVFKTSELKRKDPEIEQAGLAKDRYIESLNKRLAAADRKGNDSEVRYLERLIADQEVIYEMKKAAREAQIDLNAALEKEADLSATAKNLEQERIALIDKAAIAQANLVKAREGAEAGIVNEAELQAATQGVEDVAVELLDLSTRTKNTQEEVAELLETYRELANVQKLGPSGLAGPTESIISDEVQRKTEATIKAINDALIGTQRKVVSEGSGIVESIQNELSKTSQALNEVKKSAEEVLKKELGPEAFATVSADIKKITGQWSDFNAEIQKTDVSTLFAKLSDLPKFFGKPSEVLVIDKSIPPQEAEVELVPTVDKTSFLAKGRELLKPIFAAFRKSNTNAAGESPLVLKPELRNVDGRSVESWYKNLFSAAKKQKPLVVRSEVLPITKTQVDNVTNNADPAALKVGVDTSLADEGVDAWKRKQGAAPAVTVDSTLTIEEKAVRDELARVEEIAAREALGLPISVELRTGVAEQKLKDFATITNEETGITKTLDLNTAPAQAAVQAVIDNVKEIPAVTVEANTDGLSAGVISAAAAARAVVYPIADAATLTGSIQTALNGKQFTIPIIGKVSGQGFASGGYVRGPGTGTSDSIFARLSDKEYVIRAAAVQKYGVGLFDQLNGMRYRGGHKFATGGLVEATKGIQSSLASTSSDVNLNISLGGRKISLRGEKEQVRHFVEMIKNVEAR